MEGTVSGQPLGRHLVVLADFEVLHMLILALGKQRHRSLSMYVIPPVESSDNNAITLLLTLPFYQVTGGVAKNEQHVQSCPGRKPWSTSCCSADGHHTKWLPTLLHADVLSLSVSSLQNSPAMISVPRYVFSRGLVLLRKPSDRFCS